MLPDPGDRQTKELLPAQRRGLLLEFLRRQGAASVHQLAAAVDASVATVRRDLEQLETEGYLERTRGGALLQQTTHSTFEPDAAIAAQVARAEKSAIGRAAAALLSSGDSVIFDSGSTVHMAAQFAVERQIQLTGVTNDLNIAKTLSVSPAIRVVVLGGTVRRGSPTLLGEPGQGFLRDIHADIALVGTHSINGSSLTETSIEIATIKRAMITSATRVVLLADASKFQLPAFYKICDVTAVHEVITDSAVHPEHVAQLRDLGVKVTIVDVPARAQRK